MSFDWKTHPMSSLHKLNIKQTAQHRQIQQTVCDVWYYQLLIEYKLVLFSTTCCILLYPQGFYLEIGGPTLFDLRINLNSSLEDVARCVSAVGIGIFVGALIAGVIMDFCGQWKFLLVTGAAFSASVTIISMAFVQDLGLLYTAFFCLGTSSGLTNVGKLQKNT